MVRDICPLPVAGRNSPLPLLIPHHVHIEEDLLDGGLCPTWRSSSCGDACVCWCFCWYWTFCQKTLHTNTWPMFFQIVCWLGVGKDFKVLSQTSQGWTISLSCDFYFFKTSGHSTWRKYVLIPNTDPIQKKHEFSANLPSTPGGPGASIWVPLFVFSLKLTLVLKVM